ncbi:hypothetical protein [Pseudomonas sp.]|uniref:DUF7017 domain-containing protein n=1 Tax=Pseudomonas sp. TaxID=306 RepID=UPI002633EE09|nr:hypothetical protein [Pseudomonas sp.]
MSSSEIFALRKQQQFAQALALARAGYPQNKADVWFLRAYAWVLYDHVKVLVERFEAKQLMGLALSDQLTPYLREFASMADALRADSAFSQLLRLAGKVSKDWSGFMEFARWAGTEDFSEEDKKAFINDQGKTLDSLQKRFIRAICRETAVGVINNRLPLPLSEWGQTVLEQALKDDPQDQWLNYYQSKLHLARGERELATRRLLPVLRRQSRAVWPWALLGDILEESQPDDALTCYIHAARQAKDEQEVAKVRIHLAQRLVLAGRINEAALQTELAVRYREQQGAKVPQALQQLIACDGYQQAIASHRQQPLPDVSAAIQTLLQDLGRTSLIYSAGVIDHINSDRALSYVAIDADSGVGLSHHTFPDVAPLPPGSIVEVGRIEAGGPPLAWRPAQLRALPGLCEIVYGTVQRQEGKDFAFIRRDKDDVFVPPALAQRFVVGQPEEVKCLAVRRTNKQGKTGWRAVRFL